MAENGHFKETKDSLLQLFVTKVKNEMTKKVFTVNPEDDVSKVEEAMVLRKVNQVPVVDDEEKLVGIVARADVILAMG